MTPPAPSYRPLPTATHFVADSPTAGQRWAYFAKPLEKPWRIPQGTTVRIDPVHLAALKAGDPEAVLDVTPRPQALALAAAGWLSYRATTHALLVKHLCGNCGLRGGAQFTVCPECRGARFVWLPQTPNPHLAQLEGARFRAGVQLALAWQRGEYLDCPTVERWQQRLSAVSFPELFEKELLNALLDAGEATAQRLGSS